MKKLTLCAITLFLLIACAKKVVVCGMADGSDALPKIPSTVSINENFLIADTTIVSVSGKIAYINILREKDSIRKPLPHANVVFTDIKTQEVFGKSTELDGSYSITIPAATYTIQIQFIGFNRIIIENVLLGTGEVFYLSANLGQGIEKEYFTIHSEKFNRKVLRKET